MCLFIILGRHVSHSERMDPIDFGGQRSKSQLTCMKNKLVNVIETKPLYASSLNLAGIFTVVRE